MSRNVHKCWSRTHLWLLGSTRWALKSGWNSRVNGVKDKTDLHPPPHIEAAAKQHYSEETSNTAIRPCSDAQETEHTRHCTGKHVLIVSLSLLGSSGLLKQTRRCDPCEGVSTCWHYAGLVIPRLCESYLAPLAHLPCCPIIFWWPITSSLRNVIVLLLLSVLFRTQSSYEGQVPWQIMHCRNLQEKVVGSYEKDTSSRHKQTDIKIFRWFSGHYIQSLRVRGRKAL